MDNEIIELNDNNSNNFNNDNYYDDYDDDDNEIDPFASEKGESSNELRRLQYEIDIESEIFYCKIIIPMISLNEILFKISVPITIKELLKKLKKEEISIFDSNEKFNGRIYFNNEIIKDENFLIEEEMTRTKIIFIHDLLSESSESSESNESSESSESNECCESNECNKCNKCNKYNSTCENIYNEQILMKSKKSKSLIMKFKNLWTTTTPPAPKKFLFNFEFVEEVLNYLKCDEMIQEGLFRLSGTFTRIKTLQDRLNSGESFNNLNLKSSDCHNVTSLLKQFLRNLPEPLLTFELYEAWKALGDWTYQQEIAIKIANFLVNQLPKVNKKVLVELMKFLNERLKDSEKTRMNACNYGTVIGPNLLWHPQEDRQMRDSTTLGLSLQSSTLASQICTLFLQNYEEIFESCTLDNDSVMAYGKVLYDYSFCFEDGDINSEKSNDYSPYCDDDTTKTIGDTPKTVNDSDTCTVNDSDTCDTPKTVNDSDSCDTPKTVVDSDTCDTPKTVVDYDTCDTPKADSFNQNSPNTSTYSIKTLASNPPLRAGQLIFINRIDDSIDGWWLAYTSPYLSKFPSNYVQVIAQRSDKELIKLL